MLSSIEITNNNDESTEIDHSLSNEISILNHKELDYEHFFRLYLKPNIPCIIKNVTENWNCHKKWLINGKEIDYEYITEKYGVCQVPIANCSEKFYNAQKKNDMRLRDYLDYCKIRDEDKNEPLLYLKDWHLRKCFPKDDIYTVPIYFASDWLNEYSLDKNEDDFMFVYMGPKETWTPFHADVYQSFSWSVNLTGKKRWILFPPNEEKHLIDKLGNLPYDIEKTENFPGITKFYEIFQNPGEAIFVPSSWHHQVWNIEDTISINHNWINACNIEIIWQAMKFNLVDIKSEISDCVNMDSYDEHCQIMLKAIFGMDYRRFFDILSHISQKRLNKILSDIDIILFDVYLLGLEHCRFDLKRILIVLKDFVINEDVLKMDWRICDKTPMELIVDIERVLS